ncbi:GNAT family N-acetyltransferase [Galbibacter sp. EGI 63066]|uniref:GNAT family N-acetyltransferase n=1 Tax=Galbibacter sp. EGI 63066 TaxID=2993559 RepID=UPI0022488621|nr:GNAT family N-acetyltransferase [Galbibacter sp. EGI 63066]MCX2679047.1 GNAT family N-acetyltransferase [Galbibacter sp. EGI 63066]
MLKVDAKSYSELTKEELYELLHLRSEIFVVEQDCVYQDIDYKDQKALHIIGKVTGEIVAYTRIFKPGDYFKNPSIGRVLVKMNYRKYGYGHDIIKVSVEVIHKQYASFPIEISAQTYLKKFYETHGFTQQGEGYLEDGIPHIKMIKFH